MANRYANLPGPSKIKDTYDRINQGFDQVEQEMDEKPDKSIAQVNDVEMDADDTLTVEGSTGITVSTNQQDKKVIITATGDATPGAHGPSHNNDGADPIPDLQGLTNEFDAHKADSAIHRPIKFLESTPDTDDLSAGEIGFVPLSDHPMPAFKNFLMNGDFTISQRGVGPFSGMRIYTADRWLSGNQNQENIEVVEDAPEDFKYSLNFENNTSTTSSYQQSQIVESNYSRWLVGKKVTVSYWMKGAQNNPPSTYIRLCYPSTTDDFSGLDFTAFYVSSSESLTSDWTKYTFTSDDVMPDEVARGLLVYFHVTEGDNYPSAARITGCQLEIGVTATPFEFRPQGLELSLCQRYYFRNAGRTFMYMSGRSGASNFVMTSIPFPVTMRESPTVADLGGPSNASGLSVVDSGDATNEKQATFSATATSTSNTAYFDGFEADAEIY